MRPSDDTSYMVAVAASVLDSYPDTTEVVTLFQCETQPLMVEFRLIGRRAPQVYTLGKEEKKVFYQIMVRSSLLKQQEVLHHCTNNSSVTLCT